MNTLGIIGGLGPAASARFFTEFVKRAQACYSACADNSFPSVFMDSSPLPGFGALGWNSSSEGLRAYLQERVTRLETLGASVIAVDCNTIHACIPYVRAQFDTHILDMTMSVARRVARDCKNPVLGVIGSRATNFVGVYDAAARAIHASVEYVSSEDQRVVDQVIERVMGGDTYASDQLAIERIGASFRHAGATHLVLACTELSVLFAGDLDPPWIDAQSCLIDDALIHCYASI